MKAMKSLMLTTIAMLLCFSFSQNLRAQEQKKEKTTDDVFLVVEDMPKFKNGDIKTFQKWVMKNVKYPKEAMKKRISGKVFCQFEINKQGEVENAKIIKSVDPLLDDEVLRVVKSSEKWTAGKQRGKNVTVQMSLPVHFKLE